MACWSKAVTNTSAGESSSRCEQPPGHLEPGQPRHLDVEEHEVGLVALDGGQRLDAVAGLRDDLDIAELLELVAQLLARQLLVVDDHDSQLRSSRIR